MIGGLDDTLDIHASESLRTLQQWSATRSRYACYMYVVCPQCGARTSHAGRVRGWVCPQCAYSPFAVGLGRGGVEQKPSDDTDRTKGRLAGELHQLEQELLGLESSESPSLESIEKLLERLHFIGQALAHALGVRQPLALRDKVRNLDRRARDLRRGAMTTIEDNGQPFRLPPPMLYTDDT
jgi:hypothetical protein